MGDANGGVFEGVDCANYQFEIACSDVPPCSPQVTCGGGTPENELCGADANGGCNSTPEAFQNITCGTSICGTVWANAGTRDTDWFQFTLTDTRLVTWSAQTELPTVLLLVSSPCASASVLASGFASCGVPGSASATLAAGTYYAFVSTGDSNGAIFDGFPCGSNNGNDYKATLTCVVPPQGACCRNGACIATLTENDCLTVFPGSYWFEGQTCPAYSCPTQPTGACCVGASCVATTTLYDCVVNLHGTFHEGENCATYTCVLLPSDNCADAPQIPCGTTVTFSSAAFTSGGTGADPTSTCEIAGGGPFTHDASCWFRFTASAATATITMCSSPSTEDSVMTLFTSGSTCSSLTQLFCDDDTCVAPAFGPPRINATGLVSGQTYLLLIDFYTGGHTAGPHTLQITCP